MAAPAGGGGSAVSVLAPNGRRHTVKVTPSTVLLQVLEDTCRRQDFNPNEYDLKFQRNVLDLSLQWRFANLPNNAKLEMVPISRSREGPETMVRIALQLDDGSRLQDTFCSGQTLWELLSHFAQIRERLEQPCEASPVCVYMRGEVTGRAALQSTTLQSLGITGGSAIIRWGRLSLVWPGDVEFLVGVRPPCGSLDTSGRADLEMRAVKASRSTSPVDRDPVVCHPDLEVLLQAWPSELPDEFFEVTVDDVRRRLAQLKSERKRLEEAPLVTRAFREAQMKEKLQRYPKLVAGAAEVVLRVLFPDRHILQGCFRPSETVGDLRDFVRSHLGDPELPFHLFIAPPKTILDDHMLTLFQSINCSPLKAGRKEERELKCQSTRTTSASCSVGAGPGRSLWSSATAWIAQWLVPEKGQAKLGCGLFGGQGLAGAVPTRPPVERVQPSLPPARCARLVPEPPPCPPQADLFPAALVHFGPEEPTGTYLEPRLLEHTISPSAADALVARCMSRTAGTPPPPPPPPASDPVPSESEPTAEEGAVEPPEPGPRMAQPARRGLGKVPKWLKLPGPVGAAGRGEAAGREPGARGHPVRLHCSRQEVSAAGPEVPSLPATGPLPTLSGNKVASFSRDPPVFLPWRGPFHSPPCSHLPATGLQPTLGLDGPHPGRAGPWASSLGPWSLNGHKCSP
ncbi:Tether containing UBX domain for GLUT4 [Camelus dromedarius]|uniref:Tether containing UBX domain for GLUT4 n=1 Tax=Camelus dromedarius TaxID=9838 RepID=A0A5N4D4B4_CAMDR|nr:Tether containing UBX domain for GLUT4 [Camelus dromedarius]